ncbi:DNA primase family protein [Planococcus halotolerans]|uniref:DNA primase family protein n=1 Tax=Planococcus halotolerans TaxID=2233542 RepID=UPI001092DDA3|nr:phage/plasmid primase, P4 family [Planococcus halotolerans]QHJ69227.1 hypothetical protein DNR44_000585 [Planococcus halotolerans]
MSEFFYDEAYQQALHSIKKNAPASIPQASNDEVSEEYLFPTIGHNLDEEHHFMNNFLPEEENTQIAIQELNLPSNANNNNSIFVSEETFSPSIGHNLDGECDLRDIFINREENNQNPVAESNLSLNTDKNALATEQDAKVKRLSNYDIANLLIDNHYFAIIEDNLHYWDSVRGHFVGLVGDKADNFIRQNTPDNLKSLITLKSTEEIMRWIHSKDQLIVPIDSLAKRKEYVAFSNCIVRISDLSIHPHTPTLNFTGIVNTEYPLNSNFVDNSSGLSFETFIYEITDGDSATYYRLQELFGYVLSEIRDVKVIAFLLGPKDSGKSIILKLLETLIGEEFFTNLSFQEMNQQQLVCHLFGKKLNTCGETSEISLNRLDNLKKLSGGDYVMARYLYGQAFKFINRAALVCAGNHLPILKGIDKSNAFSERLVIFPFLHQVDKTKKDIYLIDKLLLERSYIAKWALEGLKRWSSNNYQFTSCTYVNELMDNYSHTQNSVSHFVKKHCIISPDLRTHNEVLEFAYKSFCNTNGLMEETSKSFHKHMQDINDIKHTRFRLQGQNKNGYIGIGLISHLDTY